MCAFDSVAAALIRCAQQHPIDVLFPAHGPNRPPRRVVVTGAGIITALGAGWSRNAEGFRSGRVALRPVTLFDVSRQRVRVAAEIDLPVPRPPTQLSERQQARLDRAAWILILAGLEAWRACGWTRQEEVSVVLGTTSAGMSEGEAYYRQALARPHHFQHQAARILQYQAQHQVAEFCEALGLAGPITLISNACASGANAIGHAWEMIRFAQTDRVLAGGYEGLCAMVFAGFDSLQALSPTCCRPFDAQRDGLALGEGAAVLSLESLESARRRDAPILAEILGYGATTDCHHLTQPHPQGDAALASMMQACAVAGIAPDQVGYLNAHGTGTPLNDSSEATAIRRWAGPTVGSLRVSSTKSCVGHLLGAAGAVEAVVCLMALRHGWLPPTTTLETPDPTCAFHLVREPVESRIDVALSNSFGFGGANASLVFRRWT